MFEELLAKLYSLELYYKTAHWQVKNSIFYGDHLLLDRLSEEAGSKIDAVAEKAIGVTGNAAIVNLPALLKKIYSHVSSLSYENKENNKYFEDGLKLENQLQECITKYEPQSSVGVRNLLGDLADESEGRIYLLNQRLSKGQAQQPLQPTVK
jgi:DNA-binding ferritin-like protein